MNSRKFCPHSILLACWAGAMLVAAVAANDQNVFPTNPVDLVMDKAGLLLPERAAALNAHLLAGARAHGLWVYVLTLPSLEVSASQKSGRMARLAHRYTDLWTRDKTAMVILFDDENGDAVVVASRETDRRFPPFTRNLVLTEPLTKITHGEGLTREKMDRAARLMLAVLIRLQEQARAEERQRQIVNGAMAVFFAASGAVLLYMHLRKRRAPPPAEAAAP